MAYSIVFGCCGATLINVGGPLLLGGSPELPNYYPWVLRIVLGDSVYEINREFSTKGGLVAYLNGNFAAEKNLLGTFSLGADGGIIYSNNEQFSTAAIIGMAIKLCADLLFYKIGAPENPLPDVIYTRSYPNAGVGQNLTIQIPEIYNQRIQVHADTVLIEENAVGYSRAGTTLTFFNVIEDFNLTVLALGTYISPAPPVSPSPFSSAFSSAFGSGVPASANFSIDYSNSFN